MLLLIWGLLNIGLIIFFTVTCFRATKLIKEKFSLFSSIVFVFGLLSIGHSNYDNKESNSNPVKIWKFSSEDSLGRNETFYMNINLEKKLVSKLTLGVKYGKDKQGQEYIPISATTSMEGFVGGISWKPYLIVVNKAHEKNKFEYFVDGILEWRLFGARVYSQPKEFNGIALTK